MDFFSQYSYYILLGFVLVVWCVVFFWLGSIDKKVTELEKE